MAEYALVLGLVALVAAVSFATLGPAVAALVDSAADAF